MLGTSHKTLKTTIDPLGKNIPWYSSSSIKACGMPVKQLHRVRMTEQRSFAYLLEVLASNLKRLAIASYL